jgi:hypothetical protein
MLPAHWRTIHNLELCHRFCFCNSLSPRANRLTLNNSDFHMLDSQPHQAEVNLPGDTVLQVVLLAIVLKLNVQAFLDPDLHFNGRVFFDFDDWVLDGELLFDGFILVALFYCSAYEVPEANPDSVVGLELLVDAVELECKLLIFVDRTTRLYFLGHADELV